MSQLNRAHESNGRFGKDRGLPGESSVLNGTEVSTPEIHTFLVFIFLKLIIRLMVRNIVFPMKLYDYRKYRNAPGNNFI